MDNPDKQEIRNQLIEAIDKRGYGIKMFSHTMDLDVGLAFEQLARDLKADEKQIKVSYADIAALEGRLDFEHARIWKEIERYLSNAAPDSDKYDDLELQYDKMQDNYMHLHECLKNAIESGVLTTQDIAPQKQTAAERVRERMAAKANQR